MRKNVFTYLTILLALSACSTDNSEKNAIEPQMVQVSKVLPSENSDEREFPFIAKAYQTTELSFRVGGPLNNFDVQVGDYFKAGDVIASISPRDYLINKVAKESKYLQAEAEYKRIKSLYDKKNVSAKIYEQAKASYSVTKTAYIASLNALTDTKLIAPFNGYVQSVKAEAFQDVRANRPVLSFINIDKLKLEAFIPEDVALYSKNIQSIEVEFDALKGEDIKASSWDVSKSTTSNNISFLMTAIVENNNENFDLLGGMTGSLKFTLSEDKEATLKVPQVAVCNRPSVGSYVWLYNKDSKNVRMIPVTVGELMKDAFVEITSGLTTNDLIVMSGQNYLSNNKLVTIQNN